VANPATHPDRLLPPDPAVRSIARSLYEGVRDLPIVSPHGHCDAAWFAGDEPFPDPANLLVVPDHYIVRMLYSRGVPLAALGIGPEAVADPRRIWRTFAEHVHLFRATPSGYWLDATLVDVFGLDDGLRPDNADAVYDAIAAALTTEAFRPRALFDRFGIELLATTDGSGADLAHHDAIHRSGWAGVVVPTFRPDDVVDPDHPRYAEATAALADLTGEDVDTWDGFLAALRIRRAEFAARGATATDHGHPTPHTADLSPHDAELLHRRVRAGGADAADRETYRGQLLTEMAGMSLDDGLVLQLHPGSWRNHNRALFETVGPDVGADIPRRVDVVGGLHALLNRYGNEPGLTVVAFTLDESTYSRELAPLAGHYPALRLGAPWWFHDSPEGMRRHRLATVETAGFANTVGFTDDTRAFLSVPVRHDMARRIDAGVLAGWVAEHRLGLDDAHDVARLLARDLARDAYRVDDAIAAVRAAGRS
jgi:glucuronate isomerase